MKKIFLVGGGTGGHLFPALAVAEDLLMRGYDTLIITDDRCIKYLNNQSNIKTYIINSAGLRPGILGKIIAAFKVMKACISTLTFFIKERPSLVITFGGYVAFPPLLCARLLGIPTILHEQNCFLGKVNKWFAKGATRLLLTFQETKNLPAIDNKKIIITGNPVRKAISEIKFHKDFATNPFKIVVIGGSQGAKVFSDLVPSAMEIVAQKQPNSEFHITQQIKIEDKNSIQAIYKKCKIKAELSEFFHDIPNIIAEAHLVIARSGASTIAELIALAQPAIFVPYPFAAEKHQHFNADVIAKNEGGWWIDQNEITAEKLAEKILELINNRKILENASKRLELLQSDSANIIANIAEKILVTCKK